MLGEEEGAHHVPGLCVVCVGGWVGGWVLTVFCSHSKIGGKDEKYERKKRKGEGEDGIMHPAPCSVPCYRVIVSTLTHLLSAFALHLCSPPVLRLSSPLLLCFSSSFLSSSSPVIPCSLKRNPLSMETGRLCRLFVASVVTLVTMLTGVYVIMQVMKYVLQTDIYILIGYL